MTKSFFFLIVILLSPSAFAFGTLLRELPEGSRIILKKDLAVDVPFRIDESGTIYTAYKIRGNFFTLRGVVPDGQQSDASDEKQCLFNMRQSPRFPATIKAGTVLTYNGLGQDGVSQGFGYRSYTFINVDGSRYIHSIRCWSKNNSTKRVTIREFIKMMAPVADIVK